MVEGKQKTLIDIAKEVEELLIANGLGARDVLHVLKEIETNAIIAMTMGQIALQQEQVQEEQNSFEGEKMSNDEIQAKMDANMKVSKNEDE